MKCGSLTPTASGRPGRAGSNPADAAIVAEVDVSYRLLRVDQSLQ
jgi:hypothetical protein